MSKSENQMNTLYLADDDDLLRKNHEGKTDGGPTEANSIKPEYIQNLLALCSW